VEGLGCLDAGFNERFCGCTRMCAQAQPWVEAPNTITALMGTKTAKRIGCVRGPSDKWGVLDYRDWSCQLATLNEKSATGWKDCPGRLKRFCFGREEG